MVLEEVRTRPCLDEFIERVGIKDFDECVESGFENPVYRSFATNGAVLETLPKALRLDTCFLSGAQYVAYTHLRCWACKPQTSCGTAYGLYKAGPHKKLDDLEDVRLGNLIGAGDIGRLDDLAGMLPAMYQNPQCVTCNLVQSHGPDRFAVWLGER